jgi:hypothetical protein
MVLCDDGLVVDQSRTKEVRVFGGFKGVEAAAAVHGLRGARQVRNWHQAVPRFVDRTI